MNPHDITASIKKSGYTLTNVAEETKVSVPTVCRVIQGGAASYNIASFIAFITGLPIDQLWPNGNYVNRGIRHRFAQQVVPTKENKRGCALTLTGAR